MIYNYSSLGIYGIQIQLIKVIVKFENSHYSQSRCIILSTILWKLSRIHHHILL